MCNIITNPMNDKLKTKAAVGPIWSPAESAFENPKPKVDLLVLEGALTFGDAGALRRTTPEGLEERGAPLGTPDPVPGPPEEGPPAAGAALDPAPGSPDIFD
eukprot:TRINITY_DN925_c0_g1_i1.p2 TRINITY_DN925_c0_g1~~TRINITY_DN925_c0_g1_i1.p2  ORF type:complete len:102 (+),score=35.22 TRINITY_DN925_c0_g1_i1:65-370(+)